MTKTSTDRIQKEITLRAPIERVWKAITDSAEFGEWFKCLLEGPFRVGETIRGQITHPGCEHMEFEAHVERMEPTQTFAFGGTMPTTPTPARSRPRSWSSGSRRPTAGRG